MKLVLPLVLTFAGVGAGVAAGVALRPDTDHAAAEPDGHSANAEHAPAAQSAKASASSHGNASGHGNSTATVEYVSLRNQFIVPILDATRVQSLVILSVDLEVAAGQKDAIIRLEPKIRDAFLTVLFDHANAGGFTGNFTSSGAMDILRSALREAGRRATGENLLTDVLITGIVRQDT